MSIENEIADHASALRDHAYALRDHADALRELVAAIRSIGSGGTALTFGHGEAIKGTVSDSDATRALDKKELEKAVAKVEDDAKAKKKVADDKLKAEQQAKAKQEAAEKEAAEAQAKADAEAEAALLGGDGKDDDGPVLDYVKDVRPVLLAAIKRAGKAAVAELVESFGASKAEDIAPAKFAQVVEKATALGA